MTDARTRLFESHRQHLRGLAYRMLGEMAAAEDVVQEAWLRWRSVEREYIRDPRAWLSAVTVRLSLDALKSARARREIYVGPWLPEPLIPGDVDAFAADASTSHAEFASDLSLALLYALERLSPDERAALILHDAFDSSYSEIAGILGKSEATCRKLVSRARSRIRKERPRRSVDAEEHRRLLERFREASAANDPAQLRELFVQDVVFYSDGGGRVPAAINPVRGADRVARLVSGLSRKIASRAAPNVHAVIVNGRPGLLLYAEGEPPTALTLETDAGRITAIYAVRNPEKLARYTAAVMPSSAPRSSRSAER